MKDVSIIGIDLSKNSFQAHGAYADGSVAFRRKLTRARGVSVVSAPLPCGDGGMRERALLGPRDRQVGP